MAAGIQSGDHGPSRVAETAEWVRRHWGASPQVGVVLGTGAGPLADAMSVDLTMDYAEIPHFPRSTALGHRGRLVCGNLGGQPVVAMDGRFHLYEGYASAQATLGIRLMGALGVRALLISNAAGGIRPGMANGDVMVIDSHIDLMFRNPAAGREDGDGVRGLRRRPDEAYSRRLIDLAHGVARREGFVLHQGTYVAMLGPCYETRAEYRFLRMIGGAAVGMSTVPEVDVAAELGMSVLAVSIIANVARPDVLDATSGNEVIAFARLAGPKLAAIFSRAAAWVDSPEAPADTRVGPAAT